MTTTIKVSTEVRDRLKRQASAAHRTLGEHLEHLAELGDRQTRFAALRTAIDATHPDDAASYQVELDAWDRIERA